MVIAHVLPEKDSSLVDAYESCRSLADSKACCDYALHMGITWWGVKVLQTWWSLVYTCLTDWLAGWLIGCLASFF